MKILHITETMASGVLKYLQEVVQIKQNEKDEHYIVYSKRTYTPNDVQKLFPESVNLINVDMKIKNGCMRTIRYLYQQINTIKPDVIHLHSSVAGFFGRLVTLFFPKIKVFYTPHGYSFLMTNKSKLIRTIFWLIESFLSQVKGNIIACSKSEYHHAKRLSQFRKAVLLENGIKVVHFHNKDSKPPHRQVISVGRMEEQKNPKLFIEIAAYLQQIDPTVQAVWIGDGSLKNDCLELSHALNANVIFAGWLSNEEAISYLQESSVFLQTSKWEGLPYSVLEAFAAGLPVVASDIKSHRDIFRDNYLGFIAQNKKEYCDYVVELLNNVDLANQISEANKKKLEENYAAFSEKLYLIYSC
jgi:glycosyltransferase involved in cell wall biosynthesis